MYTFPTTLLSVAVSLHYNCAAMGQYGHWLAEVRPLVFCKHDASAVRLGLPIQEIAFGLLLEC
ncbi:MAG: hypothetical protein MSS82_00140 [Bacteroidales bacterium]|nr:hypothetical protein [Bacteroidales bacterium]